MRGRGTRLVFAATVVALVFAMGCGGRQRIEAPASTIDAYVDAVTAGDWGAAYRQLGEGGRRGMTEDEFREYCDAHEALMVAQGVAIGEAARVASPRVAAELPIDGVLTLGLVREEGRWRFARDVPLVEGSDDPVESLGALAAALRSDGVIDLLNLLSDDLRARYLAEIAAIVDALTEVEGSQVAVYGDRASVTVGEITIQMERDNGAWRVSGVEQPYDYSDAYYEDW